MIRIKRGIVSCIKPLQHFLNERHRKLTIYKTEVNRVRFAAVNTITAFLNVKSKKFPSGHNNSKNKFEMKLANLFSWQVPRIERKISFQVIFSEL